MTCRKCHATCFLEDTHLCPPAWTVWCVEDGEDTHEDGKLVYSWDAEAAVSEWAERRDVVYADYVICGGDETVEVFVCPEGKPEQRVKVSVRGEMCPTYYTTIIEDDKTAGAPDDQPQGETVLLSRD